MSGSKILLKELQYSIYKRDLLSFHEKPAFIQFLHKNYLVLTTTRPKNRIFNIYDEHDFRYYLFDIA